MYQLKIKKEIFKIPHIGDFTISGASRSGLRTGYLIDSFGIYCDAGIPSEKHPSIILLSHGHYDHIASLYSIIHKTERTPVIMPNYIVENTKIMLDSFAAMDSKGKKKISDSIIPITKNNYEIEIKKNKFQISTFMLDHSVPTIGFAISKISRTLKKEYFKLSKKEIAEKKKVEDIYENKKINIFMFISDTGNSILSTLPFSYFPLVIIECTFIEDIHLKDSRDKKHLHWNDLQPIIEYCKDTHFILGHFSARYSDEFLLEKETELKHTYPNITFWI